MRTDEHRQRAPGITRSARVTAAALLLAVCCDGAPDDEGVGDVDSRSSEDLVSSARATKAAGVQRLTAEAEDAAARAQLQRACVDTDGRDIEAVLRECSLIDPNSRYRRRGCCADIEERWEAKSAEDLRQRQATAAGGADADGGANESFAEVSEALEAAKAAVLRGDQAACIKALRGAPRTSAVVKRLWDCYYSSGQVSQACDLAKSYGHYLNSHQKQAVLARCH